MTQRPRVFLLSLFLTFATALIHSEQAFGQTVRTVSSEQAQGRLSEPVTIPLAPGTGVNISFIPSDATIEKAWLDNPSWLTLDADGCLVSRSAATSASRGAPGTDANSKRSEVNCQSPSYVLHLRRINDLKFVGLPTTPDTTLSVITRDRSGARQISVFRLVRGNSTFHTVEVAPNQLQQAETSVIGSFNLDLVNRGREVAISRNLLRSGDSLDSKILNFINFVRNGTPSNTALTRSGVSLQLVNKLTQLGQSSPSNFQPQVPTQTAPSSLPTNTDTPHLGVDSIAEQ